MLERLYKAMQSSDRGQVGNFDLAVVLVGVVTALVTAAVGVMILNSVYDTMALDSNDTLYNSSQEVITATEQGFGFLPVVIIVIMAAVVIGILQLLRTRR